MHEAGGRRQREDGRGKRAERRGQKAERREQRAESRELRANNREQRAESRDLSRVRAYQGVRFAYRQLKCITPPMRDYTQKS
jgi:hypothetical protein